MIKSRRKRKQIKSANQISSYGGKFDGLLFNEFIWFNLSGSYTNFKESKQIDSAYHYKKNNELNQVEQIISINITKQIKTNNYESNRNNKSN